MLHHVLHGNLEGILDYHWMVEFFSYVLERFLVFFACILEIIRIFAPVTT